MRAFTCRIAAAVCFLTVLAGCGEGSIAVTPMELEVGMCFDDHDEPSVRVTSVIVVPCEEPHHNRVVAVIQSNYAGHFPGAETLASEGASACEDAVGESRQTLERKIEVLRFLPTRESWLAGDRSIVCAVFRADFLKFPASAGS